VEGPARRCTATAPRSRSRSTVSRRPARLRLLVTDPNVFTAPVRLTKYWISVPGQMLDAYNCARALQAPLPDTAAASGFPRACAKTPAIETARKDLMSDLLDGVYRREGEGHLRFVPVPAPSSAELQGLVQRIAERIGRALERSGLLTRDIENAYLTFDPAGEKPINSLLGASITYRIATGPRVGQKFFTLQALPALQALQALQAEPDGPRREVAESYGFSLHPGVAAKASQRDELEHLALKTPYRDGTTHVILAQNPECESDSSWLIQ
jgi:hypothetical protein